MVGFFESVTTAANLYQFEIAARITQAFVEPDSPQELLDIAQSLRMESCIALEGEVRLRPDSMINPDMPTGEIEIVVTSIEVLSHCDILPFMIDELQKDGTPVIPNEDLRLKYRYLDLRTAQMQKHIALRHRVALATRNHLAIRFLINTDFIKST